MGKNAEEWDSAPSHNYHRTSLEDRNPEMIGIIQDLLEFIA